jgi:tRNA/tmRNA/rRNA uracil-C5-methylase (TrmA/RlmC/RlmD family)
MVLIRKYYILITCIFLTICFSCEKPALLVVDCIECHEQEPATTNINIQLDRSLFNITEVKVYEGYLEDNILYNTLTTSNTETSVLVHLNKMYTITAAYKQRNGDVYIVVDSVYPRVKYEEDQCDNPCYYVYDNKVNMRVKYH